MCFDQKVGIFFPKTSIKIASLSLMQKHDAWFLQKHQDYGFQGVVSLEINLKYFMWKFYLLWTSFFFSQQEDNAIIEISLKLATIYAAQSR